MTKINVEKFVSDFDEYGYGVLDRNMVESHNRSDQIIIMDGGQEPRLIITCNYLPVTKSQLSSYIEEAKRAENDRRDSEKLTWELIDLQYCQCYDILENTNLEAEKIPDLIQENNEKSVENIFGLINNYIMQKMIMAQQESEEDQPYMNTDYKLEENGQADQYYIGWNNYLEEIYDSDDLTDYDTESSEISETDPNEENVYNIAVIRAWDSNRDQIEARKEARDVVKILVESKKEEWTEKLKKSVYVQKIIQNSLVNIDNKKECKLLKLIEKYPLFIDSKHIAFNIQQYQGLINIVAIHAVKPETTTLTSTDMVGQIDKLARSLTRAFEVAKVEWDKKIQAGLKYSIKLVNKTTETNYEKILDWCFTTLLATIYFFQTTEDPEFLDLDDYPSDIQLVDTNQAASKLDEIGSDKATLFDISISNAKSNNFQTRVNAKATCKQILRSALETVNQTIVEENGWKDVDNYVSQTYQLRTEDSNVMYKVLDHIFTDRVTAQDKRNAVQTFMAIQTLNSHGLKNGATKLIDFRVFDSIQKYVNDCHEGGCMGITKSTEETRQQMDPTANLARKLLGDTIAHDVEKTIPPPQIYENYKPVKFTPEIWSPHEHGSLDDYIRETFVADCQSNGVMSRANIIRMIWWILPGTTNRNRFSKMFLQGFEDNATISQNEFDRLITEIATEFDMTSCRQQEFYRKLYYSPQAKQEKYEDIRSYAARIKKWHRLGWTGNHSSKEEQTSLVKTIFAGLSNTKTKNWLKEKHPDVVLTGCQPEELITLALKYEEYDFCFNQIEDDHYNNTSKGSINNFSSNRRFNNSYNSQTRNRYNQESQPKGFTNEQDNGDDDDYDDQSSSDESRAESNNSTNINSGNWNRRYKPNYNKQRKGSNGRRMPFVQKINLNNSKFREILNGKCENYNLANGEIICPIEEVPDHVKRTPNFQLKNFVFDRTDMQRFIKETKEELSRSTDERSQNQSGASMNGHCGTRRNLNNLYIGEQSFNELSPLEQLIQKEQEQNNI